MSEQSLANGPTETVVRSRGLLCQRCDHLHLTRESFLVPQYRREQGLGNSPRQGPAQFIHRTHAAKQMLGTLADMRSKMDTCALCRLISRSVSINVESPESAVCFIVWVKDWRNTPDSDSIGHAGTRRMRVTWSLESKINDCYVVLLRRKDRFETSSDALRPPDDAKSLGREILELDNQTRIQSWIEVCCNDHQGPCEDKNEFTGPQESDSGAEYDFDKLIKQPYFGMIDVFNMMLVSLSKVDEYWPPFYRSDRSHKSTRPYVALSYVWDPSKRYVTNLSNVKEHATRGGLDKHVKKMPEVIQDAIELTRRLGYRYLWVDALCIVQNEPSRRSWKLNAKHMHLIYGNADLTLCAADGTASTRLRAMREGAADTQLHEKCGEDLELIITRAPEAEIRYSTWNSRAWTFQERLMSRRCLIFTNGRVYFQCRSTGMSEAIVVDKKGGWSLDIVDAPLKMMAELSARPMWVYVKCVELYSKRRMTFPGDILAAWEGMQSLLAGGMRAGLLFGLPTSHFDLALLWHLTRENNRPRTADPNQASNQFPDSDFPSWSWCGWENSQEDSGAYYDFDFLGATLGNAEEWHNRRTWIKWHIREEDGTIRPIWHFWKGNYSNKGTNLKWRGYDGHVGDAYNKYCDEYGRWVTDRPIHEKRMPMFTKKLPQYPYSILLADEYDPGSCLKPSRPLLQFFSYMTQLFIDRRPTDAAAPNASSVSPYLSISDSNGDWCGSIKMGRQYAPKKTMPCEAIFIALSEAEGFSAEECEEWTFYAPKDRVESSWDLYFVLMVESDGVKWTRLGLGKVFKEAFANSKWKEIILG